MGRNLTVALVGNPNSGKTTVFNALTGSRQHIGNWPGVTVERKEGVCPIPGYPGAKIIDLPGIYSLTATSEDERVAVDYLLGGEADLVLNVIDGTNLERNLYLTLLLAELRIPVVHVVSMMDLVEAQGTAIDFEHLATHLGSPVIGISASRKDDIKALVALLGRAAENPQVPTIGIEYANEVESEIAALEPNCAQTAEYLGVNARWVAIRLLEGDPKTCAIAFVTGAVEPAAVDAARERIRSILLQYPDESIADARYGVIQGLCRDVVSKGCLRADFTQRVDCVILNRWLGIPFFLLVMYVVFWITQVVGGAFIEFFELLGGALFVDAPAHLLEKLGAPAFAVALLANGLGAGLQTMATFLPPIFLMFFCLSILEDSGYMARAAFVMDRFMRWLGLPGKSFVPLLVGFGCTVPAIMATRALESRRDRFLTIFMTPFMSCGAKLPVYVVFGAAFFPDRPGQLVFWIYVAGLVLGIATGLLLKNTIFSGEPSHFIMELPRYHMPRMKHILLHSWERLKGFVFRAGKVIVPMVLLLGVLNTLGRDGSIGNENTDKSLLGSIGKAVTPVFTPMGVEHDNWPASVSLFAGLFAKEAVIGTLNSIYGQNSVTAQEAASDDAAEYSFFGSVGDAFAAIPRAFVGIAGEIARPLGFGDRTSGASGVMADDSASTPLFEEMRRRFPEGRHQVFAYLLFVLLYVPCLAAMGAAFNELGKFYGAVLAVYLTALGWSVATLYYQITLGRSALWIGVAALLLVAMAASFAVMGRHRKVQFEP